MEPDFLVNTQGLQLGVKANGETLNDVILPPWASSPADFVKKCREALESDYVSDHLHLWVDLIFGHAQRGEAAVQHNNGCFLFFFIFTFFFLFFSIFLFFQFFSPFFNFFL